MPPGPVVRSAQAVEALLRDLGSRLRRAEAPREAPGRWPTGIAALDRILGGGFPRGRLGEIAGPASSGRTSLALALLATTTRAGESVGVVDAAGAFDPASAAEAGLALERTLWVREPRPAEALRAAEILLRAGGFALVVLDLTRSPPPQAPMVWLRLSRAAAASRTSLVVLACAARLTGSHADLALEMGPAQPRFEGTPPLLEGLDAEVSVVRNRSGSPGGTARLRFRPPPG